MSTTPRFLSVEDIQTLHLIAIADQGGDPSLRDPALLESAVAMPSQQFGGEYLHTDIPSMAAAYAFHICMNHPFVDGNKWAGVAGMIAFLSDNGWSFTASAGEAEPMILDLASGNLTKEAFTNWARKHMREKAKMELRDFFASLSYQSIAEFLQAGLAHDHPDFAQKEHFDTIVEAAKAIPAINEANIGTMKAREAGDEPAAKILLAQSHLLTAIYRIAQDLGYEW